MPVNTFRMYVLALSLGPELTLVFQVVYRPIFRPFIVWFK